MDKKHSNFVRLNFDLFVRYGWEAFQYYYFYTEAERRSPELGLK